MANLVGPITYGLALSLSLFVDVSLMNEKYHRLIVHIEMCIRHLYCWEIDLPSSLCIQSPHRFILHVSTRVFKNLIFMRRYIKFVIQQDYSIS